MALHKIELALPSDAAALAASLNSEPAAFRRFMDGTSDVSGRQEHMRKWFAESVEDPRLRIFVIRNETNGEILSHAQWELPEDKTEASSVQPVTDEEKVKIREQRAARVKPGQIAALLQEWWSGIDYLETTFGDEPLYYLNSLKTAPDQRGQGHASRLVKRLIEEADEQGARVGLYTDGDGSARRLYERLGFVEVGRFEINLEQYGGEGRHIELSMVRNPSTKDST